MSIIVTSNTDSNETKSSNTAKVSQTTVNEKQSASEDNTSDETMDASDASSEDQEDESQSDDTDVESDESDKAPAKKSGFKRRVDKLNARISEREKEIEYWKSEALKKTTEKKEEQKTAPIKTEAPGKPKSEDYETHEDYVEAVAEWKYEQKVTESSRKAKEAEAQKSFQERQQAYAKSVQSFKKSHDDFDEVLESVDDIPVPVAIQELIMSSEDGPELIYELAKEKEELARICSLGSLAAAREFGKFEARLRRDSSNAQSEKQTEIPEPKLTKAPAPLKTVSSKSDKAFKKTIFDKDLSQAEYESLRRAELNQKR